MGSLIIVLYKVELAKHGGNESVEMESPGFFISFFSFLISSFLSLSCVYLSSEIHSWLTPGRAYSHQKLAPTSMDGQLPDGDWPIAWTIAR